MHPVRHIDTQQNPHRYYGVWCTAAKFSPGVPALLTVPWERRLKALMGDPGAMMVIIWLIHWDKLFITHIKLEKSRTPIIYM